MFWASVMKTSVDVNPAWMDCLGAIARYFSMHCSFPNGIIPITEALPLQLKLVKFWPHHSVAYRLFGEMATPRAPLNEAKKSGVAAYSARVSANSPAIVT